MSREYPQQFPLESCVYPSVYRYVSAEPDLDVGPDLSILGQSVLEEERGALRCEQQNSVPMRLRILFTTKLSVSAMFASCFFICVPVSGDYSSVPTVNIAPWWGYAIWLTFYHALAFAVQMFSWWILLRLPNWTYASTFLSTLAFLGGIWMYFAAVGNAIGSKWVAAAPISLVCGIPFLHVEFLLRGLTPCQKELWPPLQAFGRFHWLGKCSSTHGGWRAAWLVLTVYEAALWGTLEGMSFAFISLAQSADHRRIGYVGLTVAFTAIRTLFARVGAYIGRALDSDLIGKRLETALVWASETLHALFWKIIFEVLTTWTDFFLLTATHLLLGAVLFAFKTSHFYLVQVLPTVRHWVGLGPPPSRQLHTEQVYRQLFARTHGDMLSALIMLTVVPLAMNANNWVFFTGGTKSPRLDSPASHRLLAMYGCQLAIDAVDAGVKGMYLRWLGFTHAAHIVVPLARSSKWTLFLILLGTHFIGDIAFSRVSVRICEIQC